MIAWLKRLFRRRWRRYALECGHAVWRRRECKEGDYMFCAECSSVPTGSVAGDGR